MEVTAHRSLVGGLRGARSFRLRRHDCLPSFANKQITGEGDDVAGKINEQNSAEADRVVDKADHGTGNEPSALESSEQKAVGGDKMRFRSQLLDQRGDGGPEHPEA